MPVVFVDIDDTLVRSAGGKRISMTAMVARVRELHAAAGAVERIPMTTMVARVRELHAAGAVEIRARTDGHVSER